MKVLETDDLLSLRDGALFYEHELPDTPLYQKMATTIGGEDILVRCVTSCDPEPCRLGIGGDEGSYEDSEWIVLDDDDIERVIGMVLTGKSTWNFRAEDER